MTSWLGGNLSLTPVLPWWPRKGRLYLEFVNLNHCCSWLVSVPPKAPSAFYCSTILHTPGGSHWPPADVSGTPRGHATRKCKLPLNKQTNQKLLGGTMSPTRPLKIRSTFYSLFFFRAFVTTGVYMFLRRLPTPLHSLGRKLTRAGALPRSRLRSVPPPRPTARSLSTPVECTATFAPTHSCFRERTDIRSGKTPEHT